ncbi:hypothetical protein H8S51_005795 [Roseburia rectibacter]|uniref:DUF6591 domain-containing protein n=1 Tax=Roseburia rectibacter TaxID=2763062 RepID=UPI00164B3FCE|nr:DUF6591 domain-containing protein [Roseburia rectibacter]UMZ01222.1 hypothetical protein H8S51_005795 [Roseburia rectibacter]
MKRTLKTLMILVMAMLLMTGCGSDKSEESNVTSDANTDINSTVSESEDDIKYSDLLPVTEDYFKNGEVAIIEPDGGSQYYFRVTNFTDDEYEAYVEACKAAGFDDVHYEGDIGTDDKMYLAYALNRKYYLDITTNNEIKAVDISCQIVDESETTETESIQATETEVTEIESTENSTTMSTDTESSAQTDATVSSTDIIRPEFKEAMDNYEAFFDEYCEFMKKYNESDDTTSLLADYASYMVKYTDTMQKMNNISEDELTDVEVAYYAEVSARISAKLIEAGAQQ